ncbi:MAG: hypothetical protein R3B54_14815 [Bdellovibrionota bacterium]
MRQRIRKLNQTVSLHARSLYCYARLVSQVKKWNQNRPRIAAIVLSSFQWRNVPIVVHHLRRQAFIDSVYVFHNAPSRWPVPGAENIYAKENPGCIARHHFAKGLEGYDYVAFCDDDLFPKSDISVELLEGLKLHGEKSVIGVYGRQLDLTKPHSAYSSGKEAHSSAITPAHVVKGRFHVVSSGLLKSLPDALSHLKFEDDIRLSALTQIQTQAPGYVLPLKKHFEELPQRYSLFKRSNHSEMRDKAVSEALALGWRPNEMKSAA